MHNALIGMKVLMNFVKENSSTRNFYGELELNFDIELNSFAIFKSNSFPDFHEIT